MLMHIPAVLTAAQVLECREALAQAEWSDGRMTAGYQSARVKDNLQLTASHPVAVRLGDMIIAALQRSALFLSCALPLKVVPPLFNQYANGQTYGDHVDGAIHYVASAPHRVRTDLSATLFLTPPEEYDGGALAIEGGFGRGAIKLPAGDMILYPATYLHRVEPVTRGARICAFFWIQSMVRDGDRRRILFDLDRAIQDITPAREPDPASSSAILTLTNIYHNLVRQWADA